MDAATKTATRLPNPAGMLVLVVVLATLPAWIARVGLYQYIAIEVLIWCIYALGYNVALGYAGLPSFGHGAFFGIGAYGMAIYQLDFSGGSLWLGLAVATLAGGAAGGAVGMFISHRRGIYLSLMTIAFGQVAWFLAIRLRGVTEGEDGLLNLARLPADLGFVSLDLQSGRSFYYFTLAVFILAVVALWILTRSPFGAVIGAIRQNEQRSSFIGYQVRSLKWASFTLSAAVSGLAGGLFALAQRSAFPDVMALHWSGIVVMMAIVGGGLVSFWGPVLGVVFYFLARDIIGGFTETWLLWFGLAFLLVILFQPEGIAGMLQRAHHRWGRAARDSVGGRGAMTRDANRTRRPGTPQPAVALPNGVRQGDTPLYEAVGIHKRFGQQVVLERVDLRFESNKLSGIIGPNGAGKTTLFNVLTGELRPDRGTVRFKGLDITGAPPDRITAMGASRSFQVMKLFDEYTALENVVVALPEVRGRRFDVARNISLDRGLADLGHDVLARVGLQDDAATRASSLPYGKRRALDIAVALAGRPEVLFLDEPTQGLGTEQMDTLAGLIRSLKGTVTMVVIEHDMRFLFHLADTISVVHWGQVIAAGTPAELMQNDWVRASGLSGVDMGASDG